MLFLRARRFSTSVAAVLAIAASGISFAQTMPASQDMAAKVVTLTGQVSVLHDSQPWALNVGDSVQVRQVIVTGPDGYAQFQVSDGSTFEVYPNATVIFRKNPPNWRDLLDVYVGRVKIHIQKWGEQPNPNRIHTPTAVISVRGTTFDVSVDPEDDTTIVAVEEGIVDVRHALKGGDSKTLTAGEVIHVYRTQPLATHLIDRGVVAQKVMRALADAVYAMATNNPRLPGVKIPGVGGGSGNTQPTPPPPPPPPAPPPPPH